jgi:predicted secreted acid phosphatase
MHVLPVRPASMIFNVMNLRRRLAVGHAPFDPKGWSACDATRANLQSVGVSADLVLCQPPGEGNKNLRFERVQNGTASPGMPALTVVEWLGDNIQDFSKLTQAVRTDSTTLGQFGKRYFILPNPMYGSWEHVH